MEAEEEAFEVAPFGMGEVHGVVRPGPEDAEELRGLTRITDGAEDDLLEELGIDRVGAGKGGEKSSLREASRRLEIDLFVAPRRAGDILPGFGEGGRIEDDQIEALVSIPEIIEDISGDQGVLLR